MRRYNVSGCSGNYRPRVTQKNSDRDFVSSRVETGFTERAAWSSEQVYLSAHQGSEAARFKRRLLVPILECAYISSMAGSGWQGDWKSFKICTSVTVCAEACSPAKNILLGPLESATTILWRCHSALSLQRLLWS